MWAGVLLCLLARVSENLARDYEEYDTFDFYDDGIEDTGITSATFEVEGPTRMKRSEEQDTNMPSRNDNIDEKAEKDNPSTTMQTESPESLEKRSTNKEDTEIYEYVGGTDSAQIWQPEANGQATRLHGYVTEVTRQNWMPYTAKQWEPINKDVNAEATDAAVTIQDRTPTIDVMVWNPDVLKPSNITEVVHQSLPTDCVERWKHIWPDDGANSNATNFHNWNSAIGEKGTSAPTPDETTMQWPPTRWSPLDVQRWRSSEDDKRLKVETTSKYDKEDIKAEVRKMIQHWDPNPTEDGETLSSTDGGKSWNPNLDFQQWMANLDGQTLRPLHWRPLVDTDHWTPTVDAQHWSLTEYLLRMSDTMHTGQTYLQNQSITAPNSTLTFNYTGWVDTVTVVSETTTDTPDSTTVETTTAVSKKTKKSPYIDIKAIVEILANLTDDYEWNITQEFNKTLLESGVPSCPTPSEPTTTTTAPAIYDFSRSPVVSKCFVCGLTTTEIPRSAHCADAFGGDFLPLAPVDARSRSHIASFRKYCRRMDVHNFVVNPSEPRSIYGRFTGGCAVRWTDLSGVYTQRTCRAKFRPLLGKHFGSKRLAKLELALINVRNGCIASPMATLLPLSRGISLYARFHACVCTGNWCNRAPPLLGALHALHTSCVRGEIPIIYVLCFVFVPVLCLFWFQYSSGFVVNYFCFFFC
ncbi:unnamed protein product [Spodoptera littoralis]|uniref:Uncharacterized protein n=1 Tax=Spodoptera littoralis TaxID=7109 RepID=A0A9P0N7Z2_SPOLI|nr:unnamed protein product [Spodoptera littoralis]CAH1643086.1 unnamed protein product [Spodoptera littoralis]